VNFALALLSAVLLILVFPRFGLTALAPVALAPILIACAREFSWRRRFLMGWFAGAIFWGTVCYWIQFVLEVHGGMGRWGGWGTFFLFALYKGLHMGVFAILAHFLISKPWAIPAIAALWTGLERTHGPLAFAWLDLGNAAIDMPLVARIAPMLGVYGASFAFAMTGCAVALLVLRRRRAELAPLLVLPGMALLPSLPAPVEGARSALVVQPNVDTEADWTVDSLRLLEQKLALLSRGARADMVVWPETPAPFYFSSPEFREFTAGIARGSMTNFVFGAVARTSDGAPLNSAFLVNPAGEFVDRYDKINLVPFGEFVPSLFNFVNKITNEAGDFAPGSRIVNFWIDGHRVGAFICYESAFADLVRQFPASGAEMLVNLSNDGYFGGSAAREQHLAIARMRALENRRWILRATNDGISATIDPAGRITDTMPSYEQISATMRFNYESSTTFYTRHGDWFAWGYLIAGVLGCAARKRQNGQILQSSGS
jgi:apolipoprotein N-acyltransferase